MSMIPQPQGCTRVRLGKIRPARAYEIWSGKLLAGHTMRRTAGGRTTGWLAVPAADIGPCRYKRHTDAVHWLASLAA
jgi:hypothetical protein